MAARRRRPPASSASRGKAGARSGGSPGAASAREVLAWLERRGTRKGLADLVRYGIVAPRAFGVGVGELKRHAASLGRDHALAQELWRSGWYEARLLASFVDEPELVTARQMDAWARDFDSWAVVDTVCFHLFDRTAHAWRKARQWAGARPEFTRRAGFALMWSLSVHDREAGDADFRACLPLLERGALDERTYVSKAVDMALRAIGKRNAALNAAAVAAARRLAGHEEPTASRVGGHALRELTSSAVRARLRGRAH